MQSEEAISSQQSAFSRETASAGHTTQERGEVTETETQPAVIAKDTVAAKETVGSREVIAAIREMAARLGRYPSMPELTASHPAIKMGTVRKYFAGYGEALREAGFEGGGCGYTVTMDALFRDWARLARKFQRCPTMGEYERESKYSVRPLVGRFRLWSQVPRGLYGYAEKKELDVEYDDVMEMIRQQLANGNWQLAKPNTFETQRNGGRRGRGDIEESKDLPLISTDDTDQEKQLANSKWQLAKPSPKASAEGIQRNTAGNLDSRTWQAREVRPRRVPVLPDRPIYGRPMVTAALGCAPTNENGVIYLFGMLAERLGFVALKIQTEFPDCEALRHVGDGRWQHVRIEFEFESRNFLKHMHDPKGCDLIVCWEHNWKECPVEVIELRKIVEIG